MREQIRYTWGTSSLGDFIAAVSNEGLVLFEFVKRDGTGLNTLRARFPEASIELDEEGLQEIVTKLADVIEHPASDPGIALDLRGSEFERRVWGFLRGIPAGQTTSYGALAAETGSSHDARAVTEAIANNTIAILIPCHRVVKKDGSLSGYRWGTKRKRELLKREHQGGDFNLVARPARNGTDHCPQKLAQDTMTPPSDANQKFRLVETSRPEALCDAVFSRSGLLGP
jgi:AraC family transcriptional regulator, regulatory protein of adaptative response / methylated-DNA-[protein]-cysteine methyltransferase